MKKFLSIILAGGMFAACSVTAFAAEITESTDPQQGEAIITTAIAPSYIVTIPVDTAVTFNTINTDFGAVELTQAQLEPDKCVKVTLTSDGELNNTADNTKVIPYTIYEGTVANVTENVFVSAEYTTVGEKTDLTINITQDDWNKAYAGQYGDTVTFNIEYADITA